MAEILLVGCGDLGTGVGLALTQQGHHCYGLRRDISKLPAEITGIAADISQPDTLQRLPAKLDYVIYTLTPPAFDEPAYQQVYVDGLANLLKQLQYQGIKLRRLFFASSTAVYHQRMGEWVDEQSDTTPESFSGRAMLAAEQLLTQTPFPTTSIRFSGIYGPGRERLIRWVEEGADCPRQPPHFSNRIHRDDCVGVLQYLLELDLQGAEIAPLYLASDCQPSQMAEVLDWLREQLGLPAPTDNAPMKRIRSGSKRCNSRRLQDSGYQFIYPDFRSGYRAMLDARRS